MTLFINVEDLGIRIRLNTNGCLIGRDSLWTGRFIELTRVRRDII